MHSRFVLFLDNICPMLPFLYGPPGCVGKVIMQKNAACALRCKLYILFRCSPCMVNIHFDPVATLQQVNASDYKCHDCACHVAVDTLESAVWHVL